MTRGRPKGTIVIANRLIAKELAGDGGVLPLEILVKAMRDYWAEWTKSVAAGQPNQAARERAVIIATAAAPYFHAKLQSVDVQAAVEVRNVARVPAVAADVRSWAELYAPKLIEH